MQESVMSCVWVDVKISGSPLAAVAVTLLEIYIRYLNGF